MFIAELAILLALTYGGMLIVFGLTDIVIHFMELDEKKKNTRNAGRHRVSF